MCVGGGGAGDVCSRLCFQISAPATSLEVDREPAQRWQAAIVSTGGTGGTSPLLQAGFPILGHSLGVHHRGLGQGRSKNIWGTFCLSPPVSDSRGGTGHAARQGDWGAAGRTLCWPEGQARPQACTLSCLTQGYHLPPPCEKSDNLGQPAPKPVSCEIPGGSRLWVLDACLLPPHPSTEVCSLPLAPHLPQSPQLSPGSTPRLPASPMTSM